MADNNNNNPGDIFMQRRRQAAAASQYSSTQLTSLSSRSARDGTNNNNSSNSGNRNASSGKKSFLEIQQEQELQLQRDRQQQQQQSRQSRQNYSSSSSSRYSNNYNHSTSSNNTSSSNNSSTQRTLYNPNNNSNSNNSRNNRRSSSSRTNNNNNSHLPLEQGVIHTLLDKFGFILCADRPIELFFHYSQYTSGHSDELQIGDEVEFRVVNDPKLAAVEVRRLNKGTIYWEKEVSVGKVWEGRVELVCGREESGSCGGRRGSAGKKGVSDGIIRLNVDNASSGDEKEEQVVVEEEEVYYTAADYKPNRSSSSSSHSRLERKDVIQFQLVTERRTGKKYARNIVLVQSERERQRLEREAKLLENATLERGKVVSVRGDYGFLRSVTRVEEVYYHVSNVELDNVGGDDDGQEEGDNRKKRLAEGREVEFYVVNEHGGRGSKKGSGKSLSARKIKMLPEGSVKFEHELAQGVTGYVLECPVESLSVDSFFGSSSKKSGSNSNSNNAAAPTMGKIRLDTPIIDTEGNQVTEVVLHPDMYPSGTFALSRTGGEVGIWIRPGDTLLFDVIQTVVDGIYRAVPTKHSLCPAIRSEEMVSNDAASSKSIRLVKPSLCGRTEGVIRSIRDNYGFIHSAERNVDVYFPLFEVLPNEVHADLVNNTPNVYEGTNPVQSKAGRVNVEVGMEVSFDLSLQMLTNTSGGGGGRGGGRSRQNNFGAQEKEGLRGRRVQILPKGTVQEKIVVASQVKATVSKVDPKQPFVGTIELEEAVTFQSANLRYPLLAQLLDDISNGSYGDEIIFHDVLSEKEVSVVMSMVRSRDDLELLFVPVSGDDASDPQNRKIRIVRKVESVDAVEAMETGNEAAVDAVNEIESAKDEDNANTESSDDVAATADTTKTVSADESSEKPVPSKKKGGKKEKIIKTIRYDKHSLPDMSEGPLGVGDVITCDIALVRRSGATIVENITIVEKKERPAATPSEDEKNGVRKDLNGFVTEVVPSRQFGFITAVDEEGSRTGDHVFFHFRSVGTDDDAKKAVIRKGDEVKFDAGPGKNGKLSATNISILPRGTLKMTAKVDKSTTCTGYILMEPSHTSLANTPSHIVYKSNGPTTEGGRWDNVKDVRSLERKSGSSVKEEGTILLLSDPSHLFSPKPPSNENSAAAQTTDTEKMNESATEGDGKGDESAAASNTAVCIRIGYKSSSLAYRTAGGADLSNPKRGDLVTFGKTKGANLVKDIRVEKAAAATNLVGTLEDINMDKDTAVFVPSSKGERYEIDLSEVISCDKSLLQDKEKVDGILYEGRIYGVCRTKDIHLDSCFNRDKSGSSGGLKERPRLNLTVKKELKGMGGQIMAQSRMAKGPDGTNGFAKGWTSRLSAFVKEFVPSIEAIEASGFDPNNAEVQEVDVTDVEMTTT